jgi:kynureninase
MDPSPRTRQQAVVRDAADPLSPWRDRFVIPDRIIYLDGNSLGPMPSHIPDRLGKVLVDEWARGLIGSWNDADWIGLPQRTAAKIAPLIGADPDEVMVADSTSVDLFKLLVIAARLRPDRRVIVVEPTTFPTDGYIATSVARLLDLELRWCDPGDPLDAVGSDTAALALTHVDFRSGATYDLDLITDAAHAHGAVMIWDLCHSVGAIPVNMHACEADFAVGCTYKYLNGGPGSPAFMYAARAHHERLDQPLTGWFGHAEPFAMERDYRPALGTTSLAAGTPPIVAMAVLHSALDAFDGVDLAALRAKSLALTAMFLQLIDERLPGTFAFATPTDPARRGSQVSLRHEHANGVVQALIKRGVVGDFRAPDIARFGFAPLYLRFVDVYDAVAALQTVMESREWADPAFAERRAVT